jgi:hypothetical protein
MNRSSRDFVVVSTFSLAVAACDTGGVAFGPGYQRPNNSLAGIWSGQAGGLQVELQLGGATCSFACSGSGGYDYTYTPGNLQHSDANGVEYGWSGSYKEPPAPADSVDITVYDGAHNSSIYFRLSRSSGSVLRGWARGDGEMDGFSTTITLKK